MVTWGCGPGITGRLQLRDVERLLAVMTMFENWLWWKCPTLNILTISEPWADGRANKSYLSIAVKMFSVYSAATRTVDIAWAKRKNYKDGKEMGDIRKRELKGDRQNWGVSHWQNVSRRSEEVGDKRETSHYSETSLSSCLRRCWPRQAVLAVTSVRLCEMNTPSFDMVRVTEEPHFSLKCSQIMYFFSVHSS